LTEAKEKRDESINKIQNLNVSKKVKEALISVTNARYLKEKEEALKDLGEGLHALQDSYAHGQTGSNDIIDILCPNHLEQKHVDDIDYDWTDETQTKVEKSTEQKRFNDTKTATFEYFSKFQTVCCY
jgi:hypothetical protein